MVKMSDLEKEIIDFGTNLFKNFGLDTLSSKLLTTLYFEPGELSMEELSKKTGYSLASISNKLRFMELWMEKRKKPGTKKIYYYMEKDIIKINIRKVEVGIEKQILPAKKILPNIIERYKKEKLGEEEKERLRILTEYHKQILEFEKILEEFKTILQKYTKE